MKERHRRGEDEHVVVVTRAAQEGAAVADVVRDPKPQAIDEKGLTGGEIGGA